jgi:hypothetical protein
MLGLAYKFAPWVLLALMTGLYLDKRDDLARSVEACNRDKMASVAEAEALARRAVSDSLSQRIRQLELNAAVADEARAVAELARIEAESRPERVREVVRRVANSDACIDLDIPAELVDSLRN